MRLPPSSMGLNMHVTNPNVKLSAEGQCAVKAWDAT
jgi:hypothetical protein